MGEYGKVYSREEFDMHPEKDNPDMDYYKCPECVDDSDHKEESLLWD